MAEQALREWGVYVYFAADVPSPAMRRAAELNLRKMAGVGSNENVGITAMLDITDENTKFYILPPQPADKDEWIISPKKVVPNVNSASTEAIYEFFRWSVEHCPAKQIAFVFYGHGYAIDDFDPRLEADAPAVSGRQSENQKGEAVESESGDEPSAAELSANHFARSRNLPLKLIFDSTFDLALNNNQVADVIRACRESLPEGSDLAILGLDCCSMAMAEVLCEMEGCAKVAVAAQTGLPFQSWVSQRTLQKLLHDPSRDPAHFAKEAVKEFIKLFADEISTYVALSACNLELSKDLEAAVKSLASALTAAAVDPVSRAAIFKSVKDTVCFDEDGFIDFGCFCGLLSEDLAADPDVVAGCKSVRAVLKDFVLDSEFAPNFLNRKISLATGLSIWFPPWIENPNVEFDQKEQSIEYFQNGYRHTRFALATGWDTFLSRLLTETRNAGIREAEMADFVGRRSAGLGKGRDSSNLGKPRDSIGKPPDSRGKDATVNDSTGQASLEGGEGVLTTCCTTREAGVVIRASVEAFGPAGDTELTVNVKWPAASFGAAAKPCHAGTDEVQPTKHAKVTQPANSGDLIVRKPPALQADKPVAYAQPTPPAGPPVDEPPVS